MKRTFERTEPKAQLTFYNKQMLIRHHSLLRNSMSPTDKLPCYWHIIMVSRAYFGGLFSQDTLKLGIDRYGFSMNTHPSKILHCCFYGHLDFLYRYCDFGFIILKLLQPINVEIKYEYKWELATKVAGILCEKESLKKIKVNMCLYREEDVDQHIEFVNQLPDKIVEFTGDVYHIDTLESRQCQLEALNIELNDWSFDVDDSHGEITQESILARIVCLNAKCINLEAFGFDVLGLIDDVRENVNLETLKFHIKLYDWCSYIEKQQPDDYNDNDPNWKNVYDQKCRKALQNVKQLCGNRPILILTDETTTITQIQGINHLVQTYDEMIGYAQALLDVADEIGVQIREIHINPTIRSTVDENSSRNEKWIKKCDDTFKRKFGLTFFEGNPSSAVFENEKRTKLTLFTCNYDQTSSADEYTGSDCEYHREGHSSSESSEDELE